MIESNLVETLTNLESFVRSAESGGFSIAARRMGVTPAAVSRNVAMLERNLGVRLFHRSTRKLTLTEEGEHFLQAVQGNLDALQSAIAGLPPTAANPLGYSRSA
jgi:DNA-binding transcriptional LysR family regulator